MARKTNPLTNTEIKQAKPKETAYKLSDGEGLQLRVRPNGTKTWLLDYFRPYTKKRTSICLGSYPEISLANARKRKAAARQLLAQDIDPKHHREKTHKQKLEQLENTFGRYADKWLELKLHNVKTETAQKGWQTLDKHILPHLKQTPIDEIKPKIVIDILRPIEAKGALETVKRLCRYINEIMRLAVASGTIELNPLTDLTKLFATPNKENMATIKPERLPEFMTALYNASIKRVTRCLVEWQLHTMTRPIEAATAKWEDIDLENKVWVIPAERMKMKKPHTIPLTEQTLELLNFLITIRGASDYLFPGHRNPRDHINSQSANMAIKRMGFAGELVSHGLRALASTTLNEQSFDPDVIEAALAHIDKNEVRRAYNRAEYIERRRAMMIWWSNHIENAKRGSYTPAMNQKGLAIVNS
ncbi:integrase domain-containing protein [Thalassotalea montiporae]